MHFGEKKRNFSKTQTSSLLWEHMWLIGSVYFCYFVVNYLKKMLSQPGSKIVTRREMTRVDCCSFRYLLTK